MASTSSGSADVGDQAQRAARRAANSPWLARAARAGFVVSGVLHLLIAFIALRVVAGGASGQKADQSGALGLLAQHTAGRAVLWLGVVGFVGLAVWQVAEIAFGYTGTDAADKAGTRVKLGAKALVYLALASTTYSFAHGRGTSSSTQSADITRTLLQHTGGRLLVVVLGLVVAGVGVYHGYKGVTHTYREDLVGHPGDVVDTLATAGYVAKGVALLVVGGLFVAAGAHRRASGATGLDGALKALHGQPFGAVLLTVVAIGLAAYGLYSIARARYARL